MLFSTFWLVEEIVCFGVKGNSYLFCHSSAVFEVVNHHCLIFFIKAISVSTTPIKVKSLYKKKQSYLKSSMS